MPKNVSFSKWIPSSTYMSTIRVGMRISTVSTLEEADLKRGSHGLHLPRRMVLSEEVSYRTQNMAITEMSSSQT
jgi:hypothetical protein